MDTPSGSRYGLMMVNMKKSQHIEIVGSNLVPIDLPRGVIEYGVVEEKFWYWSEHGAATYMSMNKSDGYQVFQDSMDVLTSNLPNIGRLTLDQFKKWNPDGDRLPNEIDFMPVGIGDMKKELRIMDDFYHRYSHSKGKMNVIPIDLSFPILIHAEHILYDRFKEDIKNERISVCPCMSDFMETWGDDISDNQFRFITAIGVVHNASYPDIFESLKKIMTPTSMLLIDVETVGGRSDEQLVESYNSDGAKRFFYNALGLLQKASSETINVSSSDGRHLGKLSRFKNCGYADGDITPIVVNSENIEEIVATKLNPKSKKRIRISPDPNDKTIVIIYKPHDSGSEPVVLGYSTRFEFDGFRSKIEDHGFDIVNTYYSSETSPTAYLLLKLADKNKKRARPEESNNAEVNSGKNT